MFHVDQVLDLGKIHNEERLQEAEVERLKRQLRPMNPTTRQRLGELLVNLGRKLEDQPQRRPIRPAW